MSDSFLIDEEKVSEVSMIDLAFELLKNKKKALNFPQIFEEIKEQKRLSEEEISDVIAQFYTELNIDGRFISLGNNEWGLKSWYPVDFVNSSFQGKDEEEDEPYDYEGIEDNLEEDLDIESDLDSSVDEFDDGFTEELEEIEDITSEEELILDEEDIEEIDEDFEEDKEED